MRSHHSNKSSPPKIDERNYSTLRSEIKQLIPFYTPEWQFQDRDSGSALLNIFAQMVAGTIEQLNQVPEKNFMAFLNLLGVKLLSAQSAKAPVSFSLSQGTKKNVLIPAKTKIAAQKSLATNEPIVFETEKSILVTTARLIAAYSVNPQQDNIFSAPPGFLTQQQTSVVTQLISDAKLNDTSLFLEDTSEIETGDILKIGNGLYYEYLEVEQVSDRHITLQDPLTANYSADTTVIEKVVNFELFTGKNQQEHSLYLGHATLFNLTDDARLTLTIEPVDILTKLADTSLVSWQYWAKSLENRAYQWHSFDNVAIASNRLILEKNSDLEFQKTKINDIDGFWIRCTTVDRSLETNLPLINDLTDIQIDNIEVTVDPLPEGETTASPLDYCLAYNNLQYENKTGIPFQPFQTLENKHKTIYLGFDAPLEGLISLFFSLETEADDNNRPRLDWSYYQKQKAKRNWERLNLRDETNSLTQSGTVELIGSPDFAKSSRFNQSLYWIRIIDVENRFSSIPPPICKGIYLNTTWAVQAKTIEKEIVGSSNGQADRTFTLYRSPVLSEAVWVNELSALTTEDRQRLITLAKQKRLQVEEVRDRLGNTTQFWVRWQPQADLIASMPKDRHYEIDRTLGIIKFGNGKEGAIPPQGVNNIRVTYRIGGGKQGNVDRGQINRLNSSIAYVDRVTNPEPAKGGVDSELLEQALKRGSQFLKHGDRAVTAGDFERLSEQADRSIAKVKCLPNINDRGEPEIGWVSIVIVPNSSEAQPQPSLQLKKRVKTYLQQRTSNLVTAPKQLDIRNPAYVEIAIKTEIVAIAIETLPEVELIARQRLEAFLHPLKGNNGRGWDFGRSPCKSDFYALLESIPNVERVDSLSIVSDGDRQISLPPHAIVASGKHQIDVTVNL